MSPSETSPASTEEAQPCLFDSLPEMETSRRPRRRRRTAPPPAAVGKPEPAHAPPPAPAAEPGREESSAPPPQPAAVFDPAKVSNPELADLVAALPDVRLSYLVVEAARELKRRISPSPWEDEGEPPREPNPSLLRATQLIMSELTEAE
ncbi:MAG TPA: hypothetical protein VEB64_06375 [Azospirillaceae bacterium]|nr:hypothetical protein [Azospirillaceae bacterium]